MSAAVLASYVLGVVGAGIVVALSSMASLLIGFLVYTSSTKKHMARQDADISFETQVVFYFGIAFSTGIEAFVATALSVFTIASQLLNNFFAFLPYLIGAVIALPVALLVTEYHPEMAQAVAQVWQCGFNGLFYENLSVFSIVNAVRIVADGAWPFLRLVARFTRLFLRTVLIAILQCVGRNILMAIVYAASAILKFVFAVSWWIGGPGSVIYGKLELADAFAELFKINLVLRQALDCACSNADFIWAIFTEWINKPFTADLLDAAGTIITELSIQIIVRSAFKKNNGTVPGVTGPYGYLPNIDRILDALIVMLQSIRAFANFQIYIIIRELVGLFDPTLFVVGSPEEVVLASDWVGILFEVACAGVEVVRKWAHLAALVFSIVLQGLLFFLSFAWGPGTLFEVGPNVFCDAREWRAIFDYGGPVSLYFKNGSVFGHLYRAVESFCNVLDLASPYACGIIKPLLLAFLDFLNAFGLLPLYFIVPLFVPLIIFLIPVNIPFVLTRLVLHLFDSEWRMFQPPIPPRTGLPLTFWIPAPALPPAPLLCSANPISYPGYLFPWIQHYLDDPNGFHLRLVAHVIELAQGFKDLFDLFAPFLGSFFYGVLALPARLYDFVIQSVAFLNVIFFESAGNKALFFARWRYANFFNSLELFGFGLAAFIRRLDPLECSDAFAYKRIMCCLGDVLLQATKTLQDLGFYAMLVLTTVIVPPLSRLSARASIDHLKKLFDDLFCVVSNAVPPFPLNATYTIQDAVRDLLQSTSPTIVLIPRLIDALIFQLSIIATNSAGPIQSQISGFSSFFVGFFTTALNEIKIAFGDGLLIGVGRFLDQVLLGGTAVFQPLFSAIVEIIASLSGLVQQFAFELITIIFQLVAAFIGIFIGSGDVGSRIIAFLDVIGKLILFVITKFPTLILSLFFGLLEKILPPPLGTLLVTFAKLLITGLCTVIQFFVSTVVDILNAFGAKLSKPNLCCDGSSSCATAKKRTFGQDPPETADEKALRELRESLVKLAGKAAMSRVEYRRRLERFHGVLTRFEQKRSGDTLLKRSPLDWSQFDTNNVIDPSVLNPLINANFTNVSALTEGPTVPLTLDESMQLIADLVEWEGVTTCDQLVLGMNASGITFSNMSILESVMFQDCIVKRTMGEIFSVMPYFTWFPKDAFYNPLRWVSLTMDAVKVYQIYAQFQSDHGTPRDVVLSDVYRESWARSGLRVDHLTAELYVEVVTNWTLAMYVERNGANGALVDAFNGYISAFKDGLYEQGLYMDSLRVALETQTPDPLNAWISGELAVERSLPLDIQQEHLLWTAMLSLANSSMNLVTGVYQESMKRELGSKVWIAATNSPRALKRAWEWVSGSVAAEQPAVWAEAVKKRDLQNTQEGTFDFTVKRVITETSVDDNVRPHSLSDAIAKLGREWFYSKVASVRTHLLTPNSPRAQRNWRILNHWGAEIKLAWTGESSSVNSDIVAPLSITQQARETLVTQWQQRSEQVQTYNNALDATPSAHPFWRARDRVSTFATGNMVSLANGTRVAEVQVCNLSLVPFCLGCYVLDATFAESVVAVDEMIAYFEPGGYFQRTSLVVYNETRDYIDAGKNRTLCTSRGGSLFVTNATAKRIYWPSDQVVWNNNRTFFDLVGGSGGLVGAIIGTITGAPSATLSWVLQSIHRSGNEGQSETLAPLAASIIEQTTAVKDALIPARISAVTMTVSPLIDLTENRIYNYATSHSALDITYILFDIFQVFRPLLLTLDALGQFLTRLSLTFSFAMDPMTSSITAVPIFDGTGDFGVLGYIITKFVISDYAYTCDRRRAPLTQGAIVFLLLAVVGSLVLSVTLGMLSQSVYALGMGLFMLALPFLFFIFVYNYPLQNLLFLPLPLPPPCFVDDLVESLICDIGPKCPAVFAAMTKTPYTEANCYGCPLDPGQIEWLHCKRDFGMIDIIDVIFGLLRWIFPAGLRVIRSIVTLIPVVGPMLGSRIGKYATLDLTDKSTFDHLFYCSVVIGFASTPTIIFIYAVAAIVIGASAVVVFSVVKSFIAFVYAFAALGIALDNAITLGLVLFSSPHELAHYRMTMEDQDDYDPAVLKARRDRKKKITSAKQDMASRAALSNAPLFSKTWLINSRLGKLTQEFFKTSGVDYYWHVSRGDLNAMELHNLLRDTVKDLRVPRKSAPVSQRKFSDARTTAYERAFEGI